MKNKKTSQEWSKIVTEVTVIDPDGWDRGNYQYSWFEEEITIEEYFRRMQISTCAFKEMPVKIYKRYGLL